MYESLQNSRFDTVVCAVMTGMGADGTEGISKLKSSGKTYVIAQDQDTSIVFGIDVYKRQALMRFSLSLVPSSEVS